MWDDVEDEQPKVEAPAADAAPPVADEAAAAPEGEAKAEEAETPAPQKPENQKDKRLVCKHWVRPKFSTYNYLYEFQKNYYDDLIHYIDRRNRGLPVERPVPQTWGERALRTYLSQSYNYDIARTAREDKYLLHHISVGAKFQRAHTKSLISRKYSNLGFNTVYI
ncbi:flightin [Leptidea sinapis]|uniref:Flightin n=1 Tax=Leptidea sinapis TaxID=189913 RepID=A0A5E4PMR3_9NEOP|nr:flightin [Leptidea sinapis]XP_050684266.1 flightin [Leptidea sinapis]VVC86267.1 unnamed protein product [Leptidea sinapis]